MNYRRILAAVAILASLTGVADARIYKQVVNGREVVVHSNPIPVLLHRAVPPQLGRHVTEREVASGHIPSGKPFAILRKAR